VSERGDFGERSVDRHERGRTTRNRSRPKHSVKRAQALGALEQPQPVNQRIRERRSRYVDDQYARSGAEADSRPDYPGLIEARRGILVRRETRGTLEKGATMRFLITGGAGFIGSHLADELSGARVVVTAVEVL
jgi:hypothetical protein